MRILQSGTEAVKLTVRDALLLQGFPETYEVVGSRTKQFEQVGNAVPPALAEAIVRALTPGPVPKAEGFNVPRAQGASDPEPTYCAKCGHRTSRHNPRCLIQGCGVQAGRRATNEGGSVTQRIGITACIGFIATIFTANWLVTHVGLLPVGFGLMAPAGVFVVGVAFTFRDIIQDTLGRWPVVAAIAVGAAASFALGSGRIALASGAAFLASELADLAVYSPLREHNWIGAVALSNTVGLILDSALFLWLAFGSLDFLYGQMLGKFWMTLLAVALLTPWRSHREVLARGASA